jgi:hypothetical protein
MIDIRSVSRILVKFCGVEFAGVKCSTSFAALTKCSRTYSEEDEKSALPRRQALDVKLLILLNSSGVYICKSVVNDLRHGSFIR